jgi:hypothetical protein
MDFDHINMDSTWASPIYQREMLNACSISNLPEFKRLFQAQRTISGPPTFCENDTLALWPSYRYAILKTAIDKKHDFIVGLLLQDHPTTGYWGCCTIRAILKSNHLPTLKLFHALDPSIVDTESETYITALDYACELSSDEMINFFLDNGADTNSGQCRTCLHSALTYGRSLDIMIKMLDKGAQPISYLTNPAIEKGRLEFNELLVERGIMASISDEMLRKQVLLARRCYREDIALILLRGLDERTARRRPKKKLWWFRGPTIEKEKLHASFHDEDSDGSSFNEKYAGTDQSFRPKKWWQFWR